MIPVLCTCGHTCGHGHLSGGDQCWCGCTVFTPDESDDA